MQVGIMLKTMRNANEIYVVDDDPAVRDALKMALEAEGYVVYGFSDGSALLNMASVKAPGAILLDVHMPGRSGLDILRELKGEDYPAPIVIITGHGDIPMAVEAIKQGAFDFIEKPFAFDALLEQIRSAIGAYERNDSRRQPGELRFHGSDLLTAREREVLQHIATGASSKETGRMLGISPRTVEVHRARIMEKLGARNAADLMRIIFSGHA
jgi:FixJ family two-component response regulator